MNFAFTVVEIINSAKKAKKESLFTFVFQKLRNSFFNKNIKIVFATVY
jgi:hypothetical protein